MNTNMRYVYIQSELWVAPSFYGVSF